MKISWIESNLRDVVIVVEPLQTRAAVSRKDILSWAFIARNTYYGWRSRLGKRNLHDGNIPREHHATKQAKKPSAPTSARGSRKASVPSPRK